MKHQRNWSNTLLWAIYLSLLAVLLPHTAWAFARFEPPGNGSFGIAWGAITACAAAFAFEAAIAALTHKLAKHMRKMLNVSRSGYYTWRTRPVSQREMANQKLLEQIKTVYRESHETYGSPRIYHALLALGRKCSRNRVARLMRRNGIQAKQKRRFKTTTKRNKAHPVAPNRLKRDFAAEQPDQKWLADISYIPTLEGWLYLAAVLYLCTLCIVGWVMPERMTGALTITPLEMALQQRKPAAGLIHHSDQGSQYTDQKYQAVLEAHGIQASMNGVGTWYDNAPMESFFGTLKSERVHHCIYQTRKEARTDLFFYIEAFHNRRRLHSALGYLSPEAFEKAHCQQPEYA
jgi:transposase InsO family protein